MDQDSAEHLSHDLAWPGLGNEGIMDGEASLNRTDADARSRINLGVSAAQVI